MRTRLILSVVLVGLMSGGLLADAVKPVAEIAARPFPLSQVRLLDSPFKKAMEVNKAYLLKLDADRMLWPFHDRAGLPTKGKRYGGWERRDCVGQTSGHYLSACALMYASTGDEEMKKRVDYMVSELARVQAKHGDGYAGAMRTEVWKKTFSGTIEVHQWGLGGGYVPWYVLHKTYGGLRDAYRYTGNRTALEMEVKFAQWAEGILSKLTDGQIQKMLNTEFGNQGWLSNYDPIKWREFFTKYQDRIVFGTDNSGRKDEHYRNSTDISGWSYYLISSANFLLCFKHKGYG